MHFAEIERLEAKLESFKQKNIELNSEANALSIIKVDAEIESILLERMGKLTEIIASSEPTFRFLAVLTPLDKIVELMS